MNPFRKFLSYQLTIGLIGFAMGFGIFAPQSKLPFPFSGPSSFPVDDINQWQQQMMKEFGFDSPRIGPWPGFFAKVLDEPLIQNKESNQESLVVTPSVVPT